MARPIPKPAGSVLPPNDAAAKTAGAVGLPNSIPEKAKVDVAVPRNVTEKAAVDVGAPNNAVPVAEGNVGAPRNVTEKAAVDVAVPRDLAAVAQAAFPRSLTPLVDMDFAAGCFAQCGSPVLFGDLFTYSRPSSASFINRRTGCNGGYEYFLDTDYVGDVTNLLTYSEQFDHASWTPTTAIVSPNAAKSSRGGFTADKLIEDSTASSGHFVQPASTIAVTNNATITATVEAKHDDREWIEIQTVQGVTGKAFFNVKLGIIGTISGTGNPAAKIEPLNDGWFRCSVTVENIGTTARVRVSLADSDNSSTYDGDGSSGLYIWGAQLTESAKPLPYVKTISTSVTEAFTESLRIEYNPSTGENLGALIEGSSTNLVLRSEEFDHSAWGKTGATTTSNDVTSPDGTTSADSIIENAGSITPAVFQSVVGVGSYTISCYFKSKTGNRFAKLRLSNTNIDAYFDIVSGSVGTVSAGGTATIKSIGDGWFQCSLSATTIAGNAIVSLSDSDGSGTYTGDGSSGIYTWGAQVENQPFATSYIRTEASSVTRAADNLSLPSAGNYNQYAGTIVARSVMADAGANQMIVSIDDNTANNRAELFVESSSKLAAFVRSAGTTVANIVGATDISFGEEVNASLTFNSNAELYQDDVSIGSDSAVDMPTCTIINIGQKFDVSSFLFGHIKTMSIYDKALTAQEVALL